MKTTHPFSLIIFLLLLPIYLYSNQDTIPRVVTITLLNELTKKPLENMVISAYKLEYSTGIDATDNGKATFKLPENTYIIEVLESDNNNTYLQKFEKIIIDETSNVYEFKVSPKIKNLNLNLEIKDITDQIVQDALIKIEGINDKYTDSLGMASFIDILYQECYKIVIIHKHYETYIDCICGEYPTGGIKFTPIQIDKKVFSKTIRVINQKTLKPIPGVTVKFPDFEGDEFTAKTDKLGHADFEFLPKGYQRIQINPLEGYLNKIDDFHFVSVHENSEIDNIQLIPDPPPRKINIKGRVFDQNDNPIKQSIIGIKVSGIFIDSIKTDNYGDFSISIEILKFGIKKEFELEINHPDFNLFNSKSQIISVYDNDSGEKTIHNLKLDRKYDYYRITFSKKSSDFQSDPIIIFLESKNLNGSNEYGTIIKRDQFDNTTIFTVRGPSIFKAIKIKTSTNKIYESLIESNSKTDIEKCVWKLKKRRCKCKN